MHSEIAPVMMKVFIVEAPVAATRLTGRSTATIRRVDVKTNRRGFLFEVLSVLESAGVTSSIVPYKLEIAPSHY